MKFLGRKMYKDISTGRWFIESDKKSGTYQDFRSWIRSSPEVWFISLIASIAILSTLKSLIP